ncbi:DUF1294 domain-containing protein [Oceanobacillus bengalensis]|uniref:DUF1294 domain-containing protein n=1 Tax=Oceanobacillus bengalensis TaxID=1435466 RepID=A0A494YRH7_9BACI|nr:DUF1294 domain-containing protein [Oceanobacillus bengalensis]RKQ12077.1 DUF1294 domain-containing protein [Oceanobacillus bengalensis]
MESANNILFFIIGVNIIGLFMMRIDKQKAIKGAYRIPERTMWIIAFLGGAIGTYMGMRMFRHKTKHRSFIIGMPILVIMNLVLFAYLLFFMS